MSVRAHRIINIERIENSSFNLWSDGAIKDWLEDNTEFWDKLNSDACGITEVSVEALKRMVSELADVKEALESLEQVRKDIAWADAHGEEWIEYDCF